MNQQCLGRVWFLRLSMAVAACALAACAAAPPTNVLQPTASVPNATVVVQATAPATTTAPTIATPAPTTAPTAAPTVVPTPTLVPQAIAFTSPPPGQLVGSPVVITGDLARVPASGRLGYRFSDSAGQQLGVGDFAVNGTAGQAASFVASLDFNAPPQGGDVRVEVFDRDAGGNPVAQTSLLLFVAPPQAVTINSPPSGQFVGSPMVVSGNLARLPNQSNLAYVFTDAQGQQLGAGLIPVQGQPGRPTAFNASLPLNLPLLGGDIQLRIIDQNAADNAIAAQAVLPLKVVPQPQQITFTSPSANLYVGSSVVITGRTRRYPQQGTLGYRITASDGQQLDAGAFPVTGAPGQGSTFNALLQFNLPPQGGPVQITVTNQNVNTGVIIANATLEVQVIPAQQTIVIETPSQLQQVSSPVAITGRTARYPVNGMLAYTMRDSFGSLLGNGMFPVTGPAGLPARFNASILFNLPPTGGEVIVQISDVNQNTGEVFASASVPLRVAPPLRPAQ